VDSSILALFQQILKGLDQLCISADLLASCPRAQANLITTQAFCNHCLVHLTLFLAKPQMYSSFWMNNGQLLKPELQQLVLEDWCAATVLMPQSNTALTFHVCLFQATHIVKTWCCEKAETK
jgi:hypothetical protein